MMAARRWLALTAVGAAAAMLVGLAASGMYRELTLLRWSGMALFLAPLLPVLTLAAWGWLRYGLPARGRYGLALLLATLLLALAAQGLFDAGRTEPNISRRIVPVVLPLLLMLAAGGLTRQSGRLARALLAVAV
ncbi:MAG TPA: hypothetical protein PKM88_15205, partial [bacterium]|nr:hypothetical protein [bacterium]